MSKRIWWMGLAGGGLVLFGVWGAWVPHQTAALVLSEWDLAEYVKFLPGTSVYRELFYLPPWCMGLAIALIANQATIPPTTRLASRLIPTLIALGLMITLLPPYPQLLDGFQPAETRWQFILSATGILLLLASWFSRRLPAPLVGALLLVLALSGAIPPLWQFLQIRAAIETVYDATLGWGWGLAVFLAGWGLVGFAGGRLLSTQKRNAEQH